MTTARYLSKVNLRFMEPLVDSLIDIEYTDALPTVCTGMHELFNLQSFVKESVKKLHLSEVLRIYIDTTAAGIDNTEMRSHIAWLCGFLARAGNERPGAYKLEIIIKTTTSNKDDVQKLLKEPVDPNLEEFLVLWNLHYPKPDYSRFTCTMEGDEGTRIVGLADRLILTMQKVQEDTDNKGGSTHGNEGEDVALS